MSEDLLEQLREQGHAEAADLIERLQQDCRQAYLAVGVMAHSLGWWEMSANHPWHAPIEKLLDNLSAAAEGYPRPHSDLIPFALDSKVHKKGDWAINIAFTEQDANPENLCDAVTNFVHDEAKGFSGVISMHREPFAGDEC